MSFGLGLGRIGLNVIQRFLSSVAAVYPYLSDAQWTGREAIPDAQTRLAFVSVPSTYVVPVAGKALYAYRGNSTLVDGPIGSIVGTLLPLTLDAEQDIYAVTFGNAFSLGNTDARVRLAFATPDGLGGFTNPEWATASKLIAISNTPVAPADADWAVAPATGGFTITIINPVNWRLRVGTLTYNIASVSQGSVAINGTTGIFFVANSSVPALSITLTATNANGAVTSTAKAVTPAAGVSAPVFTAPPVISGTQTQGQIATATGFTYTGTEPITVSYQFKRGVTSVGTNSATYTWVLGDVGAMATLDVTLTNSAGSVTATSVAVGPIAGTGALTMRQQIEGLRTSVTPNGRQTVTALKVFGVDTLPTGVSVAGKIVTVSGASAGLDNWNITDKRINLSGTDNFVTNCYYGPTEVVPSSQYPISLEVTAVRPIVRYNTIDGFDGYGGPSTFINTPTTGSGALATGAQNWLVEYNRFLFPNSDVFKIAGNGTCQFNYFGPLTNYPASTVAWSSGVTFAAGAFVLHAGGQLFRSKSAGNIGNSPPESRFTADTFWEGLDPHGDAMTVTASDGVGQIIRRNLFDWDTSRVVRAVGTTQCIRIVRNTGSSVMVGPVNFEENLLSAPFKGFYCISTGHIRDFISTVSYALGGFAKVGTTYYRSLVASNIGNPPATSPTQWAVTTDINAPGPIEYKNNWLATGAGGLYYSGMTDAVDVWSNNRDTITDVLVTGPVLRPAALGTITVDSASLRFPDGNSLSTGSNAPSYLADPAVWAPTGNRIFTPGTDAMFATMISVPWEGTVASSGQTVGILGNRAAGTLNQTMGIWATRGSTEQEAFSINFGLRDNAGIILTGVVPVTRDQKRLLCVMRMVGSQVVFSVYHEGVLVGSVSPTMTTFAAMQLRSGLTYGAMGSGATNGFHASGSFFGLTGSMAWVGYFTGAVSATNMQNLSLGTDPLVELTAANWRLYRRLTDTSATSLTKPAPATGDTTAALTVFNTRSLAFLKGGDLTPARSGATYIAAGHIIDGKVFGRLRGETTGRVYLSGISSGLTGGVQARVFDAATGQLRIDWTTVVGADLASGAWSGYVDSPPNNGWGHIDIRSTLTPALVHRSRSRSGVGLVLGVMGQSQMARCWSYPFTGTVTGVAALSSMDVPSRTATTYGFKLHPINNERIMTGSLASLATALPTYTTEPLMVLNLSNAGQGTAQLLDDSNTDWNWSEMEASLELATGPLAQRRISGVAINWLTNFANQVNNTGGIAAQNIQPLFDGTFGAGATPHTVNHYLKDGLTFPASTKYALSPPTRNVTSSIGGPYDSGDTSVSVVNHGLGRGQWRDYATGVGAANITVIGPFTDDIDMGQDGGNGAGGPHQNTLRFEGHNRTLIRVIIAALRAAGVETRTNASLGAASINGGRTAITIAPTLPNGGTLQTAWVLKGISVPVGATTVQGFEVQNGGTGAWTRSGFTAEIVSGQAVLTKTSTTWSAATKVRYAANGPLDYGTTTDADMLYHGMLYESGADEGGLGLPLAGLWTATV